MSALTESSATQQDYDPDAADEDDLGELFSSMKMDGSEVSTETATSTSTSTSTATSTATANPALPAADEEAQAAGKVHGHHSHDTGSDDSDSDGDSDNDDADAEAALMSASQYERVGGSGLEITGDMISAVRARLGEITSAAALSSGAPDSAANVAAVQARLKAGAGDVSAQAGMQAAMLEAAGQTTDANVSAVLRRAAELQSLRPRPLQQQGLSGPNRTIAASAAIARPRPASVLTSQPSLQNFIQ